MNFFELVISAIGYTILNNMHDSKTIAYALSATVLILSLSGAGFAFAEFSDEITYKALEGKHIWEKLEYLKSKTEMTPEDKILKTNLEKQFSEIVKELNSHGIATTEQWDADPEYWHMKNVLATMETHNDTADGSGNQSSGFSGASPSPCYCPQEFRTIAGFEYKIWGIWNTMTLAKEWQSSRMSPEELITAVKTKAEHAYITPFAKFGLVKEGIAKFNEAYSSEKPGGDEIDETYATSHVITNAIPDHKTVYYAEIRNPPIITDIQIIVDLKSLS